MIYLASPFSDPSPEVELHRTQQVIKAAYVLQFKRGLSIFSPIVYSASMNAHIYDLPTSAEAWHKFNREMFTLCDETYILAIEGFGNSKGVILETSWALKEGHKITIIEPAEVGLCK